MKTDTFIKALNNFLEDRIDPVIFEEISKEFAMKEKEINKIKEPLKSLPEIIDTKAGSINIHQLLREIDDEKNDLFTIAIDISYKKGFSEGIKLIVYNLIVN